MDQQGIIPKPKGLWCSRCITCRDVFTSSQGLAGYKHKHKSQGTLIRGALHEKFFYPSTELPALYRQLGTRKSTPIVLRIQGRFYHPRSRNKVFYGSCRLPGCPCGVLYQLHQAMVLQVSHVVACTVMAPLLIQDHNLFSNRPNQLVENTNSDDQEELDLELRL